MGKKKKKKGGSLATRIVEGTTTDADALHLEAVKEARPKLTTISDWYHALKGDSPNEVRLDPHECDGWGCISRLIEIHFGKRPADDAETVKQAVKLVANQRNKPLARFWRMSFAEFHTLLELAVLTDRLDGPPTRMQRMIWAALDGKALTADQLEAKIKAGRSQIFYVDKKAKTGGLKQLVDVELVMNKRTIGYFRRDAPPLETN